MFSEQAATFALYNINSLVFITEVESVYSAVRTESLCDTETFRLLFLSDFDPQFVCRPISVNILNTYVFRHQSTEASFVFSPTNGQTDI